MKYTTMRRKSYYFRATWKGREHPIWQDLYFFDCPKKCPYKGVLKHIMGAYSRNAAVGLLLCSEKLFASDRKEEWRGDEGVLLNQWLWKLNHWMFIYKENISW